MTKFRDRVASGLSSMKYPPDMFIFTGEEKYCVGEMDDIICGFPVIRTALTSHYLSDDTTRFVPFIAKYTEGWK